MPREHRVEPLRDAEPTTVAGLARSMNRHFAGLHAQLEDVRHSVATFERRLASLEKKIASRRGK